MNISGQVQRRQGREPRSHPGTAPASQADHFFLNMMVEQWRDAPHKDAPAMLQSDRALALASTQVKLYRDEFLTQANWADHDGSPGRGGQALHAAQTDRPERRRSERRSRAGREDEDAAGSRRPTWKKKISAAKDGLKIGHERCATKLVIQETREAGSAGRTRRGWCQPVPGRCRTPGRDRPDSRGRGRFAASRSSVTACWWMRPSAARASCFAPTPIRLTRI